MSRVGPEPTGYDRYDLYPPTVACPPGSPMKKYGGMLLANGLTDGYKFLCSLDHMPAPCVVYSLGSRGDFSFETAILEATPCHVHTFDCTIDGNSMHARHVYHPWCIGPETTAAGAGGAARHGGPSPVFKTWSMVLRELNHTKVHVLKVDIEGYEYELLADWAERDHLPAQVGGEGDPLDCLAQPGYEADAAP